MISITILDTRAAGSRRLEENIDCESTIAYLKERLSIILELPVSTICLQLGAERAGLKDDQTLISQGIKSGALLTLSQKGDSLATAKSKAEGPRGDPSPPLPIIVEQGECAEHWTGPRPAEEDGNGEKVVTSSAAADSEAATAVAGGDAVAAVAPQQNDKKSEAKDEFVKDSEEEDEFVKHFEEEDEFAKDSEEEETFEQDDKKIEEEDDEFEQDEGNSPSSPTSPAPPTKAEDDSEDDEFEDESKNASQVVSPKSAVSEAYTDNGFED